MMMTAAFVAVTGALLVCLLAACQRDETLSRIESWAAALTFLMTFWTILSFMLGFVGIFRMPVLVLCGACAVLIAAAMNWRQVRMLRHLVSPADFRAIIQLPPLALTFMAMAATAAIYFLSLGWRSPVVDFDGLSYHLGLAVHLFQDGDFRHYPYESIMTSHFSRGVELLMAISIMLCGKTTLVNSVQWMILPAMIPAVHATARALGCDRGNAVVAASIPLTVPVILYQSAMAYADLFSCGWFTVALCAVLGAANRSRIGPIRIIWMFSAAGLALAAKANAGILAGITGTAALVVWGLRAFFGSRRAMSATITGFLLSANAGLPWMAYNWMKFGSPLYPFSVTVAGTNIASGVRPFEAIRLMAEGEYADRPLLGKVWESWTTIDFTSWSKFGLNGLHGLSKGLLYDPTFGYAGDSKFGGFGAFWLACGLPSLIGVLLACWKLHGGKERLYIYAMATTSIVAFLALVAPWWSRFALFLPVFGGIAAALVLEQARRWNRGAFVALGIWFVAWSGFDWATCLFQNRESERLRRYHAMQPNADDAPIHFSQAVSPDNPVFNAVRYIVDHARPGDVVSFRTPREALFTGYFVDDHAQVRLFPLPTFWPDEGTYDEQELAEALEENNVRLLLVSAQASVEFRTLVESRKAQIVYTVPGYDVYDFASRGTGSQKE
ncbi:hypothetical protein IT570_09435 [Candidatus Sumerlaeota bacterium]|nr:hypothetical protein [Candidatus Sumerlaeota bacterium]